MLVQRRCPLGRPHGPRHVALTRPGGDWELSGTWRPKPGASEALRRSGESMYESQRVGGSDEADSRTARQICCHLQGALPPPRRSWRVRET